MENDIPDVLMGDIFVEAARSLPEPVQVVDFVMKESRGDKGGRVQEEKEFVSLLKSSAELIEDLPERVKFFALTTNPSSSSSGCILACDACGLLLKKSSTFIRCAECLSPIIDLCIHCFGNGAEFGNHINSHSYTVVHARSSQLLRQSRPISKLDIRGLLRFMEAVEVKGTFNFSELERTLDVRPGDGEKLYLELISMLSSFEDGDNMSRTTLTPLSEEPSNLNADAGGGPANFNVLRDEFEHEYVPEAETLLAAVSLGDSSNLESLFEGYNGILDERERRRKILKNAKLVNLKEYYNVLKKRKTDEREMFEKLRMFIRPVIASGNQLSFLENLSSILTARKRQIDRIKRLATLKKHGLFSEFAEAIQFDSDRKKRSEINAKKSSKAWTPAGADKKDSLTPEQAIRALPGGSLLESPGDVDMCIDLCISPQHFFVIQAMVKARGNAADEVLIDSIQDGVFGAIRRYLFASQGLPFASPSAPFDLTEAKLRLVQYCRRS